MPSPVTPDNIPDISLGSDVCQNFQFMLRNHELFKQFVGGIVDDSGFPQLQLAREIGSMIHPPGAFIEVAVPVGTTSDAAKTRVESMWLSEEEIGNLGSTVLPFWALADGSRGSPDLRGRFRLMADWRSTDAGNVSGIVGVDAPGGSNAGVKLTPAHIPKHRHQTGQILKDTPGMSFIGGEWFTDEEPGEGPAINAGGPRSRPQPHPTETYANGVTSADFQSAGDVPEGEIKITPPYYVTVIAWRTNRMS